MNKIARLCAALLAYAFCGVSATWAQGAKSAYADKLYPTEQACLNSSARNYYTPMYLSSHGNNPADGKNIVVAPLESDACVYLHVVGKFAWVWQSAGTKYRWNKSSDGTLSLLARDDCGNIAKAIVYPVSEQMVAQEPRQQVVLPTVPIPSGPQQLELVHRFPDPLRVQVSGGLDLKINWDKEASRSGGHGLRNAGIVIGAVAVVGTIACAILCPRSQKVVAVKTAQMPEGVITDSVTTHPPTTGGTTPGNTGGATPGNVPGRTPDGKCIVTSYPPPPCPPIGGMRSGNLVMAPATATLDVAGRRSSFSIPLGLIFRR